jgi:hypothetical protein
MCQRKIIGKGIFRVVPAKAGTPDRCACPNIIAILDIDKARGPSQIKIQRCIDVKTDLYLYDEFDQRIPVFFRLCMCPGSAQGFPCGNLPPVYLGPEEEDDDEDDFNAGPFLKQL